jgi:hypothetical protein
LDREHWVKLYSDRYGDHARSIDSSGSSTIPDRVFENSRYTVFYHAIPQAKGWPKMVTLSIRHHHREAMRDWRDLQRIKNEIMGPECEAVELFPAESRLVDTANQYHLWCIVEPGLSFPFGFTERAVADGSSELTRIGSRQRKMENPPPDAISEEDILQQQADLMQRAQEEQLRRQAAQLGGGVVFGDKT